MSDDFDWHGKHFAFYQNKECEFFPCHKTDKPEDFNCLFCYCPLYALGDECGGNFSYSESGIKCCDGCMLPHRRENYGVVMEGAGRLCEKMKKKAEDK